MKILGLNCRIPRHLFASHRIRIASIVIDLVLQSTPTHVMAGPGYSAIAPLDDIHCTCKIKIMYQLNRSFNIPPSPLRAYPGHLTPFLAWEGGNLITTHREWGIWSLASMSCYEINHGRDVKLSWIQRKILHICGGLVENQRPTQAVFCIWRCLRLIYIYSM